MVQPVSFNGKIFKTQDVNETAVTHPTSFPSVAGKTLDTTQPFESVLQGVVGKTTELKFSTHAKERLQMRNIQLGSSDLEKISDAVNKAAAKGSQESLLVMHNSNLALIVSIKNRTVITALDGSSMKNNVFTNIDSAIIV